MRQLNLSLECLDLASFDWKKTINEVINSKNRNDLLLMIKNYRKLDYNELVHEKYEVKEYISKLRPNLARQRFALRSRMYRTVKLNFPSDKAYAASGFTCCHCPAIDSQSHWTWCQGYSHLREGINLNTDEGLVTYYKAIIKLRDDCKTD